MAPANLHNSSDLTSSKQTDISKLGYVFFEFSLFQLCQQVDIIDRWRLIHVGHSCWWSCGTKLLSITVCEIFNGDYDAKVDMTLNDL